MKKTLFLLLSFSLIMALQVSQANAQIYYVKAKHLELTVTRSDTKQSVTFRDGMDIRLLPFGTPTTFDSARVLQDKWAEECKCQVFMRDLLMTDGTLYRTMSSKSSSSSVSSSIRNSNSSVSSSLLRSSSSSLARSSISSSLARSSVAVSSSSRTSSSIPAVSVISLTAPVCRELVEGQAECTPVALDELKEYRLVCDDNRADEKFLVINESQELTAKYVPKGVECHVSVIDIHNVESSFAPIIDTRS